MNLKHYPNVNIWSKSQLIS